jgi:hypothetical protein
MKKYIKILMLFILTIPSKGYCQQMTYLMGDELPFSVKFEKSLIVPDSLRKIIFQKGLAVLSVKLNIKGKVEGFNIMKISLKDSLGKGFEFSQGNRIIQKLEFYPEDIKLLYPFFSNYVSRMIIKRKKDLKAKIKKHNYFSVLVRLT